MIVGILLASEIKNDAATAAFLAPAERLICADGGADHAERLGLKPDLLAGDFDSVSPAVLDRFTSSGVPIKRVPYAKDETDAELVLRLARDGVPAGERHTLLVVGATGDRLDHTLGTLLHLSVFSREGWDVQLTDGETLITLLAGPTAAEIAWPPPVYPESPDWYISSIALQGDVYGLTYVGLAYPLEQFTLPYGSTRGISNAMLDSQPPRFSVSLTEGLLAVIVTPNR